MFPLLTKVNSLAGSASTSSQAGSIMMHHSRDTAHKQWAETQVLILTGVARYYVCVCVCMQCMCICVCLMYVLCVHLSMHVCMCMCCWCTYVHMYSVSICIFVAMFV